MGVSSVEPISVGPGSGMNSGVAATIGGFSAWNQQQGTNAIITDHVRNTRERNVFTRVCDSVRGEGGVCPVRGRGGGGLSHVLVLPSGEGGGEVPGPGDPTLLPQT